MDHYQAPPADPSYNYNPNQQMQYQQQMAPVISVKQWMLTIFIMIIPVVNIIMMFVWAFGEGNPTKKNYFKASLLWFAIVISLYFLIFVLMVGLLATTSFLDF